MIYIPKGVYVVTNTLNLPPTHGSNYHPSNSFYLIGDGPTTTILDGRTLSNKWVMKFDTDPPPADDICFSHFQIDGIGICGPAWNGSATTINYKSGEWWYDTPLLTNGGCLYIGSTNITIGGYAEIRNCAFMLNYRGLVVSNYVNLNVRNCWNWGNLRNSYLFHHVDNLALRDSWWGGAGEMIHRSNFFGVHVSGTAIPGVIENCEGGGNFLWADRANLTIRSIDIERAHTNGLGAIVLTNVCRVTLDNVKFNWYPWGASKGPPPGITNAINIRCENGGNAELLVMRCFGGIVYGQTAPNEVGIWFYINNLPGQYTMLPKVLSPQNYEGKHNLPNWTNAVINGRWCNVPEYVALTQPPYVAKSTQLSLHGLSVDTDVSKVSGTVSPQYAYGWLSFGTNATADIAWPLDATTCTNQQTELKFMAGAGTYPITWTATLYTYVVNDNDGSQRKICPDLGLTITLTNQNDVYTVTTNWPINTTTNEMVYRMLRNNPCYTASGPQTRYLTSVRITEGPF